MKESWWKYEEGYWIGDEITFTDSNLVNDTINMGNLGKARIIKRVKYFIGNNNKIVIQSLSGNELGYYVQK